MSRMIIYEPDRFSDVPWLSTDSDLRRQGEAESFIEDAYAGIHIDTLYIKTPFGKGSDAALSIRAQRGNGNDGGRVTMAIGVMRYVPEPANVVIPAQSNPIRQSVDEDNA